MKHISCKLTIFEGPDGGGKSSAAEAFARETGARYVHFGPLPRVKNGLARMYVEAMLPALLGYQDVVFDRCWLSEVPYGSVFRNGVDRLGDDAIRMLERLAMRCGAVVVYCLPNWRTVRSNYLKRKEIEYLKNEDQLRAVYEVYASQHPGLPFTVFDYEGQKNYFGVPEAEALRMPQHYTRLATAGNWNADIVLVGEEFAERKDQDPWYQWPFASFSGGGCSRWLTSQLREADVAEKDLLWTNADQTIREVIDDQQVIALGTAASQSLEAAGIKHKLVAHPQAWKRFNHGRRYPLIDIIKELL